MTDNEILKIALPKGRLGNKVYQMLEQAGYECATMLADNRILIHTNFDKKISYLEVKPSDVAIYVEKGAADIGVVGKDTLMESAADVYELKDLKFGICRLSIAYKNGYIEDFDRPLRVATKYHNITKRYYATLNRQVEIIKLNGSIELAPILGLSDVIVDIVETGSTLKENNLTVGADVVPYISARLVANKASFKFKAQQIQTILDIIGEKINEH